MKTIGRKLTAMACVVTVTSGGLLTGCASMNNTERGATIGAATGGAIGAAIGRNNGGTAKGAIIGAILGGAAGAVVGRRMDNQARDLDRELEGADVERVGEGIAVTFESGILFPFDSDALLPAGRSNLQDLARSLQNYPGTEVLIVGHTDATGSDSYNMGLSQRRAESAASFLAAQGIARARIRTQGRGEVEPIASNDTEAGRGQNRRVEVAIFASEEYRQQLLREYGNQ